MSERILEALMQLFAIVASVRGADDLKERREVVLKFLEKQLNKEFANKYITQFDEHYRKNIELSRKSDNQYKVISRVSTKVTRISVEINRELSLYQKYIVLIQIYEYINTGTISFVERGLVQDVIADKFNIPHDEFELIRDFILNTKDVKERIVFCDNENLESFIKPKYVCWEDLGGEIHFVYLPKVSVFLFKYFGDGTMEMNGAPLVNGQTYVMRTGCSLRNGVTKPIFYYDMMRNIVSQYTRNPITLEARNVVYNFNSKVVGLHRFSFEAHSGTLVGIMGVSGSGKSTFSNVISGMAKPNSGNIYINNIDIYDDPEAVQGLIGYVTQDDILFEDLTVYENLYYNARLTFDNMSLSVVREKVDKVLQTLGLYEVRNIKVGSPMNKKISGGQRKRLNIALELIREPAILILDEPTSGLSSHDAESLIELLKDLAIKGKLIFTVIHQPSSDIFKMFDQLLVLDTGGYLIYNGNPVDSINYFKRWLNMLTDKSASCKTCGNINVEQVLNLISMPIVDEYGNNTQIRKVSAKEWYDNHIWGDMDFAYVGDPEPLPQINFKTPNRLKQLYLYLVRDVKSKMANLQYLLINFLEAPLLALLLAGLLRYYNIALDDAEYSYSTNPNIPIYIIISVIVAFFIGLTVSAEEIIHDRPSLRRERFLNLSRMSYIMSKCVLTMALSAVQMLLFVGVGNSVLGIQDMYEYYWLVLFSTAVSANLLGLNLSDSFRKTVNIYIIIPFMVIPQLILSGVFVSFDKMNPEVSHPTEVPAYGNVITARWAFEALIVNQYIFNNYEKHFYVYHKAKSQATFYKDYWVPTLRNRLDKAEALSHRENQFAKEQQILNLIKAEIYDPARTTADLELPAETAFNAMLFGTAAYDHISTYLDKVRRFNVNVYNRADAEEQRYRRSMPSDELEMLREQYSNKSVEEVVRAKGNTLAADAIKEFDGKLWQKSDVVFQDTDAALSAPLYSPYKVVNGMRVDTYLFDVLVIWAQNMLLLVALLLGWFDKFFSLFTRLMSLLPIRNK